MGNSGVGVFKTSKYSIRLIKNKLICAFAYKQLKEIYLTYRALTVFKKPSKLHLIWVRTCVTVWLLVIVLEKALLISTLTELLFTLARMVVTNIRLVDSTRKIKCPVSFFLSYGIPVLKIRWKLSFWLLSF